ncbi:hypothetical protein MOBT1_002684 [Malassezia obtusa]|uniref:Uncharacterized protein n=1 Tax=Malassezia obtusa TaxID=76774 RepID=A0AAF0E5M2_9BASI|nr:hypothetical protein MOBT1_002684 [Malassezia obtusa]
MALHYEDAPDAQEALERYVFALDFLLPDTDLRNRDLLQELDLSQRDLDDPNIEEGVGTSDIPLRQRKLFAQPLTTGGPTSDASSEESTDESSA